MLVGAGSPENEPQVEADDDGEGGGEGGGGLKDNTGAACRVSGMVDGRWGGGQSGADHPRRHSSWWILLGVADKKGVR
jgi:hypothetical protein